MAFMRRRRFTQRRRFMRRRPMFRRPMFRRMGRGRPQRPELKFVRTLISENIEISPVIYTLNAPIPQGLGVSARIGNDIKLRYAYFMGNLSLDTETDRTTVRMTVLLLKQNSTDTAVSNFNRWYILPSGAQTYGVNSMLNPTHAAEVQVLWDHHFVLSDSNRNTIYIKKMIPLFNRRCIFGATAGGAGSIAKNTLLLGLTSDAIVNQPELEGQWRVRYTDP